MPNVFNAPSKSSRSANIGSAPGHALLLAPCQSMPSITSSPLQTPIVAIIGSQHHLPSASASSQTSDTAESNLLPMKTFVHKVLKCLRTSGSILQAALCYLEAICLKVPKIWQQDKIGIRAHYQPETKILLATHWMASEPMGAHQITYPHACTLAAR